MSSKKGKAKVSQTDLRRMMQQMKTKKSTTENKNGTSQNNGISQKRMQIGESYLKSKSDAKRQKLDANVSSIISSKTATIKSLPSSSKATVTKKTNDVQRKRLNDEKLEQKAEIFACKLKKISNKSSDKPTTSSTPLVSGFYSNSDESSDDDEAPEIIRVLSPSKPTSSGAGTSKSKAEPEKPKKAVKDALPAGFFDNPETDAKIRGVETPADKMDREWESFQRALQHEADQSEHIIDEEQETGQLDREIDEIDEQIQYYHLVDKLCDKRETTLDKIKQGTLSHKKPPVKMEESNSSSDEEDELLDWREKDAFT